MELLTIVECAEYLTVSDDTIRRLIIRGDLAHVRIGGSIRIRQIDADEYVSNRVTKNWTRDTRGRPAD